MVWRQFFFVCPQAHKSKARMYGSARNLMRCKVILCTRNTAVRIVCVHQRVSLPDRMEREPMKKIESCSTFLRWFTVLLLSVLAAGCGGGGGTQIFGTGGASRGAAPTVTAVAPLANATGVPISTKIITAAFSKPMDPATLTTASFTLACPAGTPVTGAVTYLAAGSIATLTLPAAPDLPPSTVCTATITTAAKDSTGIPLAANFVWTFTTGVTPDTTRPRV